MDETDHTPNSQNSRIQTRMSKEQKAILLRLMNDHDANVQKSPVSRHFKRQMWSDITIRLNNVPGAQKTDEQWKKTWQDMIRSIRTSASSESQALFDYDKYVEHEVTISEEIVDDNEGTSNDAKDDNGNSDHAKRQLTKRMSKTQKKLLYSLVHANAKLQTDKFDASGGFGGTSSLCLRTRRREWQKIALKLNSVTGPHKTWQQWKKCWSDIKKYYVQRDLDVERLADSDAEEVDESFIATRTKTNRAPNIEMCDDTPSAVQLKCLVRKMVEHRDVADVNVWMALSSTLNTQGSCVKNWQGWKNVWETYKSTIRKAISTGGTKNLDKTQRIAYEYIKRERSKKDSVGSMLKEHQLQLLQRTADQECNIAGSLVAVKLRSMQKEQKLIAEKLISEILFQGQMEMFQYSDKAVNIPGYF